MAWVAALFSLAVAAVVVPAGIRALAAAGLERENFRGRRLPFPAGAVILAAAAVALGPLALVAEAIDEELVDPRLTPWLAYIAGVAFLGLLDDVLGGGEGGPRGWRGHGAAVLRGEPSTGALKALGAAGLAALVLAGTQESFGEYVVAVALLVLTTNLLNLLDLRPGRAVKGLGLIAIGTGLAAWTVEPAAVLAIFLGPVLVVGAYDLRERAMLGDTGSNLLGALAGAWLVVALAPGGRLVALAAVIAFTIYGEVRSLGATIEKVPLIRALDSVGRVRESR